MADVSRDLFLSDLASNCSTSGCIPEVTTGLSLTDTSATIGEIPRIKGETSINRCHSVDPVLLTLPSSSVSPSVRDDTLHDLSHDFPGVNEVLHNMSSVLNIPEKRSNSLHRTSIKTQTTPMTTPITEPVVATKHDPAIYPPLLKQPEQQAPSLSKHSPLLMPIVQYDAPTLINFLSKAQPSEPVVSLPHIPIRQFVPQLIHPSQLGHHNEHGLPSVANVHAPPALLTVNDPLLKMKGNLKLLTFPQQPVHLAQYKPPDVLPVNMDTSNKLSQTIIIPPAPPHNPVPPIEHSLTGKEYCKKRILELKRKATLTVSEDYIPLNTPTLSSLSNELDSHSGSPHLLKSSDDLTLLESPTSTSSRIDTPTPSDTTPTSPDSSPNVTSVTIQTGIDVGVQVGIEEDESSRTIDEQKPNNIALPLTINEEVPVIPQYNNQYIMVNDVIDDETPSEGSSDNEFKMKGSEVDEECVISDELLQTQIPDPAPTEYCESIEDHDNEENDDVLKKFGHLEKQLQLIEDKACAMKEDFQHSRQVLHSIDRISNDSYDISGTCEDGVRVPNYSLSNKISSGGNNNRKNQFVGGDVVVMKPLINHEDVPVVTDNIKEETLKQWMIKKRKERTTEYKKERSKRIALERIPFTPTKQPNKKMINSSDQPFPESKNSDRTRPTHLSDRSKRLSDAETLLSDLLTSSPVAHDRLPVTRSALSNAMKSMTLSCTIPRDSSSHVTLGKSHVTSMDNTKTEIVHHGQMKVKKRQLSSIECLSEAEQMKMTEILQKTSEDRIERESNTSLQSSIDWSQIDQLINTN